MPKHQLGRGSSTSKLTKYAIPQKPRYTMSSVLHAVARSRYRHLIRSFQKPAANRLEHEELGRTLRLNEVCCSGCLRRVSKSSQVLFTGIDTYTYIYIMQYIPSIIYHTYHVVGIEAFIVMTLIVSSATLTGLSWALFDDTSQHLHVYRYIPYIHILHICKYHVH